MASYKTIEKSANDEFTEKRSRFIGYVKPVKTVEEATAFIDEIKSKHWDAKHNVYAYILRDGNREKFSDDGEPSGTAGMPVLDVLKNSEVTDACVVVTRYFGGILLGTGGLVRAYKEAASLALSAGGIVMMKSFNLCSMTTDYNLFGKLQNLIGECGGKVVDTAFSDEISIKFQVPEDSISDFTAKLTDLSFGKASFDITDIIFDKV